MENKKVLLSVKDLVVKFRVRGRILTAIRGISLDIYENESIAIVGESGSGKSVFTKTFAGMLDSNGFVDNGSIIFNDDYLADTIISNPNYPLIRKLAEKLDSFSGLEAGAAIHKQLRDLEAEKRQRTVLSDAEQEEFDTRLGDLRFSRTEAFNARQTFDPIKEKDLIKKKDEEIKAYDAGIKALEKQRAELIKEHARSARQDLAYLADYEQKHKELEEAYRQAIATPVTPEQTERNLVLAKEIYISALRCGKVRRPMIRAKLVQAVREAMKIGIDLFDDAQCNAVFQTVTLRVRYLKDYEENGVPKIKGYCIMDMAKVKDADEWMRVRGSRIATVFQDPMTSLNPIITIGKQISSVIMKHQGCSEVEARNRALTLMQKVGIPNAEKRFDDYPFEYSGGMRQRIVIAIALSCQPKILICDEPTTALDVTIQAQILKLLKDLQKELGFTIVFITHDLGVVANIADRVGVLYAGQLIELGTVEEVFYDPRHPYTWALLSSLPQLAQRDTKLYSITGTPPSLYNKIVGDPFAPRNPYCLKIDTLEEPPMFQITETHFAKTWLEDPRAPKVQKPEIIENIHEKLVEAFNI